MQPEKSRIESKLFGLLCILAGLIGNPIVVERLLAVALAPDPRVIAWSVALAFVAVGIALWSERIKLRSWASNLLLVFFTFCLLGGLSVLADRVCGKLLLSKREGLIFSPNSEVVYDTAEFNITARINTLGFRDHEYPLDKGSRYRILALGDSFTYGWGVNIEDAWCKLLEGKFRQMGLEVEVLNLGQGGTYPGRQVRTLEKAVPLLKPDLVIVAVLKGDDLFQTVASLGLKGDDRQSNDQKRGARSLFHSMKDFVVKRMYPHLLLVLQPSRTSVIDTWREQAQSIHASFTDGQKARFAKIDAVAQKAFFEGKLNPVMIKNCIVHPDYFSSMEDTRQATVQLGIEQMARDFGRMRDAARTCGAEVIVVSVPYRCVDGVESLQRLGLAASNDLVKSKAGDYAIGQAATKAKLDFYEFADTFQAEYGSTKLFYDYDGHFTPAGNEVFSRLLFEVLQGRFAE